MADLIDRREVETFIGALEMVDAISGEAYKTIICHLESMPSAQPEIRCKDCVDYDTSWIPHSAPDRHYCPTMDSFMPDDGYCSYAERRTDG